MASTKKRPYSARAKGWTVDGTIDITGTMQGVITGFFRCLPVDMRSALLEKLNQIHKELIELETKDHAE